MRDIQITPKAFGQLRYWADQNSKILDRVFELLEDTELTFNKLYENKKIINKFVKGEKIYLMHTKLTNFVYDYNMLEKKSYRLVKSTVSHNEKFLTITAKKIKKVY